MLTFAFTMVFAQRARPVYIDLTEVHPHSFSALQFHQITRVYLYLVTNNRIVENKCISRDLAINTFYLLETDKIKLKTDL